MLPDGYEIDNAGNAVFELGDTEGEHARLVTCKLLGKFHIRKTDGDPDYITIEFTKAVSASWIEFFVISSRRYDIRRDSVIHGPRPIFDESGRFAYSEHGG